MMVLLFFTLLFTLTPKSLALPAEFATNQSTGVTHFNPQKVAAGYNLVTTWTDESGCLVFSSDGKRSHNFPGIFCQFIPGQGLVSVVNSEVVFYDTQLKEKWRRKYEVHHDMFVATDEKVIYLLSYRPVLNPVVSWNILSETIIGLDYNGKEVYHWETVDHTNELLTTYRPRAVFTQINSRYEMAHMNSLEVLTKDYPQNGKAFKKGNFLVSLLLYGALAVIDRHTGRVAWTYQHPEVGLEIHSARILRDGRLVYFKNTDLSRGGSEVRILNPATGNIDWRFSSGDKTDFFSRRFGHVMELENGHLLVTFNPCKDKDSCNDYRTVAANQAGGRAIEISLDKEIVWQWVYGAGEKGTMKEVYQVRRVPETDLVDFAAWLK
jgi:hypothetical protein